MQGRNWILAGAAVFVGLLAVFIANTWFSSVEKRQEDVVQQQKLSRIVVAMQDMAFGTPLSGQNLKLAAWPAASVPAGAFTSLDEAMKGGRVALRPIVAGEPVLASKVSGPDGRASISANLPAGKLAFAIPINDVSGVGGFVRPGDMVDVLLTRRIPGDGATDQDKMTDVVLEAVPVIGIDQVADEKKTDPAIGKTATLEVDTVGAQKLALARELGVLSLALRNVQDALTGRRPTVVPRQLSANPYYIPQRRTGGAATSAPASRAALAAVMPGLPGVLPAASAPARPKGPTMTVVRGSDSSVYEVQRGH
ncbi:MAG: Flp pilus assembly protein CpaB [Novosphingobium sp.]